jgi:hypothetical protein
MLVISTLQPYFPEIGCAMDSFVDAVDAWFPPDEAHKKLSKQQLRILAELNKSESAPVDLETFRQAHGWEIVQFRSDLIYLSDDHRVEAVGERWGIVDGRLAGKVKITLWGEDGLAKGRKFKAERRAEVTDHTEKGRTT